LLQPFPFPCWCWSFRWFDCCLENPLSYLLFSYFSHFRTNPSTPNIRFLSQNCAQSLHQRKMGTPRAAGHFPPSLSSFRTSSSIVEICFPPKRILLSHCPSKFYPFQCFPARHLLSHQRFPPVWFPPDIVLRSSLSSRDESFGLDYPFQSGQLPGVESFSSDLVNKPECSRSILSAILFLFDEKTPP